MEWARYKTWPIGSRPNMAFFHTARCMVMCHSPGPLTLSPTNMLDQDIKEDGFLCISKHPRLERRWRKSTSRTTTECPTNSSISTFKRLVKDHLFQLLLPVLLINCLPSCSDIKVPTNYLRTRSVMCANGLALLMLPTNYGCHTLWWYSLTRGVAE